MATAAVIGCGDVATIHLEAIDAVDDIELVALCDTDPDALDAARRRHDVPGFGDHRKLLAQLRPDVVHICTPHDQHVPVAIDCLAAGVDVISEKPLAHTEADGQRLIEAAEASPAKIGVCLQNRYNATAQEIRRLLDSGELGAVQGGSATVIWSRTPEYYRAKPWRGTWAHSGGGLLINQAIHTVDLMQWFLGDVVDVRGHAANHRLRDVIEVEDTAEIVLDHGDVTSVFYATLDNATNAPVTIDIVAENADLHLRGSLTVTWRDGRVDVVNEREAPSAGRAYWGVSHEILIRDFYARRSDPESFWISPREAAKSLRIIKQVYAQSTAASLPGPHPAT